MHYLEDVFVLCRVWQWSWPCARAVLVLVCQLVFVLNTIARAKATGYLDYDGQTVEYVLNVWLLLPQRIRFNAEGPRGKAVIYADVSKAGGKGEWSKGSAQSINGGLCRCCLVQWRGRAFGFLLFFCFFKLFGVKMKLLVVLHLFHQITRND